jgi:predicted tellurium resistance membrane protein TerC
MRRRFPTISLSVGLVIGFMAILGPARGQPQPAGTPVENDPDKFPRVVIEPADGGERIKGKLKLSAITLKTEVGSTTIAMEHVRRITFQKDGGGKGHDGVHLNDKSIVRGQITTEPFIVEISGAAAVWKRADIREITIERDVQLPWTAILFGLLTLSVMEIILGIDNVIFLAIVVARLPKEQQPRARKIGLAAALLMRIGLLFSLSFLLTLTEPIFTLPAMPFIHDLDSREVSWRDLILFGGGAFLIAKSVVEVHKKLEESKEEHAAAPITPGDPASASGVGGTSTEGHAFVDPPKGKYASFGWTIATIAVIDIVFSLDSVITAIGMVEEIWVMVIAMVIAMAVMLYFAGPIGHFVEKHPTVKILALAFLILIGVMLVAEGLGQHFDKGYIYAAMAFAVVVEMINMQIRRPKKKEPPGSLAVGGEKPANPGTERGTAG